MPARLAVARKHEHRMQWHWRVDALPELAPLSPRARQKIVGACNATAGHRVAALGVFIVLVIVWVYPSIMAGYLLGAAAAAVAIVVGGGAVLALVTVIETNRLRKHARAQLRRYFPDGLLPICPDCGYDLRGNAEERCPECGAATVLADEHGRPQPLAARPQVPANQPLIKAAEQEELIRRASTLELVFGLAIAVAVGLFGPYSASRFGSPGPTLAVVILLLLAYFVARWWRRRTEKRGGFQR